MTHSIRCSNPKSYALKIGAIVVCWATTAIGGIVYDFVTVVKTPYSSKTIRGRVWVDGEAYRAEVARDGSQVITISRDSDRTAVMLDPKGKTWSNRSRVGPPDIRSSRLFLWPVPGTRASDSPLITYRREEASVVAGQKVASHVIECSFRVWSSGDADHDVKGSFDIKARIWSGEELPPLPMQRSLRTGYPLVDRELEKIEQKIHGMVMRHELTVTRTFEGGPAVIERTITTVDHLERVDVPPSQFETPRGFTYAGPQTP